ncbi:Morn repeat domain containing protein [Pandoravirus quercus]|uniref:Morn repeat domain containing protein n=1 Tax=Pandoravirus quercus TaxID=2107709 RepID=A0A2U7UAE0_9VIRU|nr:Morn repeat domain containing protein [Pandoravirus quercus]AVK75404.1 Morn repeat domain containing protein [Pandoravirus quercus]
MSKKIEAAKGASRGHRDNLDDVDEHVTDTPFDRLPDEIIVAMIVTLGDDLPTVVRCAQTCKRHYALAMDAIVWRHLCESRFGPPLHRRFLDVGKTWRWLYEAQARVIDGDTRGPQTGAMLVVVGFAQWIYWGDVVDGAPEGYGLALPLPQTRTRCPVRVPDDSVTCQQQGHYEGYWHDGKRHGYGVEVTDDGRSYAGQWQAGKYHGYGVYTDPGEFVYNGAWDAGYRCGHGSITYSNGDCYKGNWHAHQPHGHGVYTWVSGATYEGAWRYDARHGHGSFIGADGTRYGGDWEHDRMHGCGTMVYADGCHYTGDWSGGKRHGYGLYTCTQGSRYDGQWQDDTPHGYGESANPHRTYRGLYRRGQKHGYGVMVFSDGAVYEGQWAGDMPTGYGTLRRPDNSFYQGWWVGGRPHGQGVQRWGDGSEYAGAFKDDRPHGTGVHIRGDGQRTVTTEDATGTIHALVTRPDGFRYEGGWDPPVGSSGQGTCVYADGSCIVGTWSGATALAGEVTLHGPACTTESSCEACVVMGQKALPKSQHPTVSL